MNVAQVLASKASARLQRNAIIFESKAYTFQSLFNEIKLTAAVLNQLGVKAGDRVAIQLPKSMDFIFLFLANLSIGATTLPLNTAYREKEVAYFLEDSGSSLFVTTRKNYRSLKKMLGQIPDLNCLLVDGKPEGGFDLREQAEKTQKPGEPDYPAGNDATAIICYTSGTTGQPKGAMITHQNLIDNTRALNQAWHWKETDRLLHVLPLFHVHGLNVALLGGILAGSTIVMQESFDPLKVWQTIAAEKCTMLMGVPTMYYRLLKQWETLAKKPDIQSMRVFISGSAPLSQSLFEDFERRVGFRILERYGMTETGMIATNPIEQSARKPGSVGYPFPGVQVRIADSSGRDVKPGEVGEICIKGSNVFKGYWQNPLKTQAAFADSWLKSGDLGYQDPKDGMRLYIVGREKELIITGGYNVYPKEVESVIDQVEGVRESAVIGLPDEDFGERVTAVVILEENAGPIQADRIIAFCKKGLAGYKCPKTVIFRPELPRNAMGKIQKQLLKAEYASAAAEADPNRRQDHR